MNQELGRRMFNGNGIHTSSTQKIKSVTAPLVALQTKPLKMKNSRHLESGASIHDMNRCSNNNQCISLSQNL